MDDSFEESFYDVVRPYQFEPECSEHSECETSFSGSESEVDISEAEEALLHVSEWCECDRCINMPTVHECRCCQNMNVVDGKIGDLKCITQHEGFIVNCLNIHVLETSYYEYVMDKGPLEEGQQIHEFDWLQFLAWRKKYNLKGLFPFPVVGTLPYMFMKEAKKYKNVDDYAVAKCGAIHCGIFGRLRVITVSDPDILKKIMIKDHIQFINRFSFMEFTPPPLENLLVNLKDTDWKRVRSILTPTFSAGKLKKMTPEMNHCTRLLVEGLTKKAESGEVVDSKKHAGCFTMDVIAGTAFGIRPDSYNNPDDPFVELAQKVFGQPTLSPFVLIALLFPNVMKLILKCSNTSVFYPLDSIHFFCDVIKKVIQERKEKQDTGRTDLLQLMLNAVQEEDGKCKKLTEDEILAQGFIVFIAGYDTTASLLTFLTNVLAVHPDIQDKLVDEIKANIADDVTEIKYDMVMEMPYLEQVINETLRMYPPVNRMDRCSSEVDVQIDGHWFPANTSIAFSIWSMHHNEKFYPDPHTFRPERFSPEEKATRDPFVFMPFGQGPRNCIGMRLALLEVKIALVGVLRKLRFVKCEETEINPELDVETFVRTKNPIKVKVELR